MAVRGRAENPILWQEATHQERNAPRWMRWGRPAGIVALAAILMLAPMMLALGDGYSAIQIGLLSIWVVHTGIALRAIIAGANTVSREHVGLTWDTLVLTGVSARQILLGKWRAALRRVGGWMLALGVVRLVMLPVHMVGLVKIYAWVMCGPYAYGAANGSSYCASGVEFDWVPWAALVAVAATVLMTLLDVLCCTAVGMAASALTRRGTLAAVLAISIRFAPVATFAAFTRYEIGTTFWRWWRYTPFALADGGTTPLMELTFPVFSWTRASHENALPGLVLSGLLLFSLLAVAVIAAWIAIRRTGALPHPRASSSPDRGRTFLRHPAAVGSGFDASNLHPGYTSDSRFG